MFAYQQNANRLNMFAVLSKNSRNQVHLDYGNQKEGGKSGYPIVYNDSSSRTYVKKINAIKPKTFFNNNYSSNTHYQTISRVNLLRRGGASVPKKVGAY